MAAVAPAERPAFVPRRPTPQRPRQARGGTWRSLEVDGEPLDGVIQRILLSVRLGPLELYRPGRSFGVVGQVHHDVVVLMFVTDTLLVRAEAHAQDPSLVILELQRVVPRIQLQRVE